MEKVCIFCGQRPINKTKEHIISKWLIELTGNPKRPGFFGFYREDKGIKEMHLSFDKFTFPACKECNKEYSELEGNIKPVILDLLAEKPLNNKDINLLLTWFDKVRIGIWLASLYYNNPFGIDPNFYISQGTFTRDRMIIIYKNRYDKKRLNFIGNLYEFQMLPICISLIINNFAFINIAKTLLLSEGFGLAIPQEENVLYPRGELFKFKHGSQKIQYPLVDIIFNNKCSEFYQPILDQTFYDKISSTINVEHKHRIFINEISGIGKIFYQKSGNVIEYPKIKSNFWIPPLLDISFLEFFRLIGIQTFEIQNYYFIKKSNMFDSKLESEFHKQKEIALEFNNIFLDRLKNTNFKEFE